MPVRNDDRATRLWEYTPDIHGLIEDISDALVCREQHQFLITDEDGDIPSDNRLGLGFYSHDTRHISTYSLLINGEKPFVLLSAAKSGFSQEQVLGNRRARYEGRDVGRATVELARRRYIGSRLSERLDVTNHNSFDVALSVDYIFNADFADIFEVRGHVRTHPGSEVMPSTTHDSICYRYLGADGVWRRTLIAFDPDPVEVTSQSARYNLVLGAGECVTISLEISTDWQDGPRRGRDFDGIREDYSAWRRSFAGLYTDNNLCNESIYQSISDLRTLWTKDDGGGYFAAGVPWYCTMFGRDTIITALQVLPLKPDLARNCLMALARTQSTSFDPFHVEQPGKMVHELRDSELNVIEELPYKRYYGSIDSTPLFLMLAAEYYRWTADIEALRELRPAIHAALRWIRDYGRNLPDPYLRYETDSVTGLRNQGWKDSADSIMHEDGSLCDGPIALVEVQGYLYAAYRRLGPVLEALGDHDLASDLRKEAGLLREAFQNDFWLDARKRVALALDGENRPSSVISSNAGQALLSGLLTDSQAESVRRSLFRNDMFSGWGIRTLSATSKRYFPLGYHLGTVWPHDNALIGVGLKRYGFDAEVMELLTALFDASQGFPDRRLPELFGGQPRAPYLPPVPYPVACRPQAWSAGSMLQLLLTTLGLHADAANGRLFLVRPRLPFWLNRVHLEGLRVAGTEIDLRFERNGDKIDVAASHTGGMQVIVSPDLTPYED